MRGEVPAAVVGVGAALAAQRLAVADVAAAWGRRGGAGTLAVCAGDEDALTLAWAAGVAACRAAGVDPLTIGGLFWGTARPPMAEGPSHAFLAAALGLASDSAGLLASGSVLAGMDALCAAWDAIASGSAERVLVVASDALVPGPGTAGEQETGAGAVALVLEAAGLRDEGAPALLTTRATSTRPVLDRYRGDGMTGTADPYDARLARQEVIVPSVAAVHEVLVKGLDREATWSLPDLDGRIGKVLARSLGVTSVSSEGIQRTVGDTGSAAPLLGAVRALSAAGHVAVVGYGAGRATGVVVEVAGPVPGAAHAVGLLAAAAGQTAAYTAVARSRGHLVPLADPVPMGVPPGSAAFVRGNAELLGLEGRRCPACGIVAVPPSIHPVCPACGSEGGDPVALARSGRVHTFVVNETMPPPFEAPLPLIVCDLDDGARVMLQGMPEDADELAIGDGVTLELRRYAIERGVPVYGFKARRCATAAEEVG